MPPTMLPSHLPREVLSDPKRAAEIEVFDRLKGDASLNERWHVFYSLDWIGEHEGITRDGEADFVVAHPDVGFLVLEVKGGLVTVKPGPKWTTVAKNGVTHQIQNGMQQAMKSKKVLLKALIDAWGSGAPFFRARHGVVLPDSPEPSADIGDLARGMPRDLFIFSGQVGRLGLRVRELVNWNAPGADDKVGMGGNRGIDIFKRFYGREVALRPSLRDKIEDVDETILALSETQTKVLTLLRQHERCVIQGAAGTGKTVIAKAKALMEIRVGRSVVFLCFNRLLRDRLEEELRTQLSADENALLDVYTFHGFCLKITGRQRLEAENETEYFNEILPACFYESVLETAIAGNGLPIGMDTLIIDEGQDFSEDWLSTLLDLAELSQARISVFYDGNQCIYRQNRVTEVFGVPPHTLSENFRNSKEIYDVVSPYVDDEDFESLGPAGPSVRFLEAEANSIWPTVNHEIAVLVESEGVRPEDIVVLTGSSIDKGPAGNVITTTGVQFHSIWEYKGLDCPVVVLANLANALTSPELAYVGVSRARSMLIVVDLVENLIRLRNEIPIEIRG